MKHILYFLFVSPLAFSFDSSDNCDDIELFFLSPQDGFVSENQKLKVEFGTKNINISPAGIVVEKQDNCKVSGHHHLIINNAYKVEVLKINRYHMEQIFSILVVVKKKQSSRFLLENILFNLR